MRFTDSKKRVPWFLLFVLVVIIGIIALGFCQFKPTPKTIQKTIVYETD